MLTSFCAVMLLLGANDSLAQPTPIDSVTGQFESVPTNGLRNVDLSVAVHGNAPPLVPETAVAYEAHARTDKSILFTPANVTHRRLLFEQPLLERHGLTRNEHLQPVLSYVHFLGSSALFPLELVTLRNRRCDSSLGWGTPR